jgi:hypothetical protein
VSAGRHSIRRPYEEPRSEQVDPRAARNLPLDEGTAWLVGELRRIGRGPLDRMCDGVPAGMGGSMDDDAALLAVRLPSH